MTPLEIVLTAFSGWAAAALGWVGMFLQRRDKVKERTAKEDAERKIATLERRAPENRPLYKIAPQRFNSVKMVADGKLGVWSPRLSGRLLSWEREEVHSEMPAREHVLLLVEHLGAPAYEVVATIAGLPAAFEPAEIDDGKRVYAIQYAFDPANRGERQEIKFAFLAANGARDVHTYATKHGFRMLERIDPK